MEDKTLNFHIYRYHLLPVSNIETQVKLFPDKKFSPEEVKAKKNEFFGDTLLNIAEGGLEYPIKLHDQDEEYYLFKFAQKKITTITKNFETETIENEPYVYIAINNNPSTQKIAISDNPEAFSNPDVVKNILLKELIRRLNKYGLNVAFESLFDSVSFWEYVSKYEKRITFINFQYIKPNLANISKTLPEDFKAFTNNVNSHENNISIKAPQNGVLENINSDNKDINGFVDYASEGAGSIKLKAKGVRKQLNTKDSPIKIEINELSIEGAPEQVIKAYKDIVE
jgi:hypothetical protein